MQNAMIWHSLTRFCVFAAVLSGLIVFLTKSVERAGLVEGHGMIGLFFLGAMVLAIPAALAWCAALFLSRLSFRDPSAAFRVGFHVLTTVALFLGFGFVFMLIAGGYPDRFFAMYVGLVVPAALADGLIGVWFDRATQ